MYFPAGSNPPKPSNHFCPTSSLTSICGHQWQQSRRRRRRRAGLMQALGPGWTGPGLRSLTPCFSFGASISATLQSLFSIRKRNACGRKVEAGRERGQHTHTRKHSQREGERRRAETQKTKWLSFAQQWKARGPLFSPHSVPSLHSWPPFISPARHMAAHRAFKSHKRCLHVPHNSL